MMENDSFINCQFSNSTWDLLCRQAGPMLAKNSVKNCWNSSDAWLKMIKMG